MKSSIVFILSLLLIAVTAGGLDDKKPQIIACINKQLVEENKEFKLSEDNLKKLMEVVDDEIKKIPLTKKSKEEKQKIMKEMENAAKSKMPDVPTETVKKILTSLGAHAKKCAMKSMKGPKS
ncbi:hypothetical protein V502_04384 [Pseudogymnoascus sp. VKM F-4520 (FW-2644)]|nr:hypothetical protein V502_04384 [Pseudogymnoascus sp. VKM F-4520 (FW-2644)]